MFFARRAAAIAIVGSEARTALSAAQSKKIAVTLVSLPSAAAS